MMMLVPWFAVGIIMFLNSVSLEMISWGRVCVFIAASLALALSFLW